MKTITKTCPTCNITKEVNKTNFRLRKTGTFDNKCNTCSYERNKKSRIVWISKNPNYLSDYINNLSDEEKLERLEKKRSYRNTHPWYKSYKNAETRCNHDENSSYFKRGVQFKMTAKEFKFIWDRDGAAEMKKPSINRINPDLDYTIDNCEYIELEDNIRGKKSKRYYNSVRDY
jgi:hypothetical protein